MLFIIGATVVSKRIGRRLSMTERIREAIVIITIAVIFVDKMLCLILNSVTFISDLLKPLILFAIFRNLREASVNLLIVFWKSKNMIILLIIYYSLFGWITERMFLGTAQANNQFFPDRETSIWTMMTVFGGANLIIRILPSYSANRFSGILFYIFNIIGIVFFMNVVIAIMYHMYLAQVNERINNFKKTVETMLTDAFNKFCKEDNTLTYENASSAIAMVLRENTKGEYDRLQMDTVIRIMDKEDKGAIELKNFLNLLDILHVLLDIEIKKTQIKTQVSHKIPKWKIRLLTVYKMRYYD